MSHIEIIQGDFLPHPKAQFRNSTLVLFKPAPDGTPRKALYPADQLMDLRICEGVWERYLASSEDWVRAMSAAAAVGAAPAVANGLLQEFFFGQRALVTWLNAVVGGAAATAALKSTRKVRFRARFRDGTALEAKMPERALTHHLQQILVRTIAAR